MESLDTTSSLSVHNPWVLLPAALFVLLLLFFLVKFFSVFFDFLSGVNLLSATLIDPSTTSVSLLRAIFKEVESFLLL